MQFIAIFAFLTLSGCSLGSVDELYSLPKASEQYLQLEELALLERSEGFAYSAPIAGNYRQSILFYDLDGDGNDEALVFFRGSDQILKICIYSHFEDKDFQLASTVEGEGTAIRRVDFADLDGDGMQEIIVAWQMSTDIRIMQVYSISGWNSAEILSVSDCLDFRFADMDNDGNTELITLHTIASGLDSISMYKFPVTGEPIRSDAKLSLGITSLSRMRTGYIAEKTTALFVEGILESGSYFTDILIDRDGNLTNISISGYSGVSDTLRDEAIFSTDIDNDKIMEVPSIVRLFDETGSRIGYYRLDWYKYNILGQKELGLSTYHCYSDDWYIVLPKDWLDGLIIRREDSVNGERVVIFSVSNPQTGSFSDILVIYKLTGDNRHDRVNQDGRFILLENLTTIYAAKILNDGETVRAFTEDDVKGYFDLIYMEWNAGVL